MDKVLRKRTRWSKFDIFTQVILSQINTSAAEYFFILHNILVSNMFVWGGVGEKKLKRGEWEVKGQVKIVTSSHVGIKEHTAGASDW